MFIYSACRIPFIIFRLRYGRRVGVYENHSGWNRDILNDATDKRRRQRNNHQHKIRNNDWIDNWRQIERTNKRQKIIIYGIEWFLAVFNTQLISFIKMCFRFIFTKHFVNVFVIFIARNSHPVISLGILFLLCNKYITDDDDIEMSMLKIIACETISTEQLAILKQHQKAYQSHKRTLFLLKLTFLLNNK